MKTTKPASLRKPGDAGPGRGMDGLAGRRRFTADCGAECTYVRPALASLRASAMGTTGMVFTRRPVGHRFGQVSDLTREVKELTRKLRGGMRSGKRKAPLTAGGKLVSRPISVNLNP